MPRAWISLGLAALAVAVFAEAGGHEFLAYDDDRYVAENRIVRDGLTLTGARWAATTLSLSNWHPLTWLSHMLDASLFGLDPAGPHWTNIALHAANTVLVFLWLSDLLADRWRSAFVAAAFAVHPLHVESVAWISERKDLLSAAFFLLSLITWTRYARAGSARAYWGSLALFAVGGSAKAMVVTLPAVLLLLDAWPFDRLRGGARTWATRVREKLPFFAVSAVLSGLALVAQSGSGAFWSTDQLPVPARLANALVAYASYVQSFAWPRDLAIFYPYPQALPPLQVLGALAALVATTLVAAGLWRRRPALLVGWLWFGGMLVPVIGLVQVGNQALADRYMYLPLLGLLLAVAFGLPDRAMTGRGRMAVAAAGIVLLLFWARETTAYLPKWRDTESIFSHALAVTEDNAVAHDTLGWAQARRGELRGALAHFDQAIRIAPGYGKAWLHRGAAQLAAGAPAEAVPTLERAVVLDPDSALTRFALGSAYEATGALQQAVRTYREGLALDADNHGGLVRLAWMFSARPAVRNGDEAVALAQRARAVSGEDNPSDLDLLAAAHAASGAYAEGVRIAERAMALALRDDNPRLAMQIEERRHLYAQGRPYDWPPTLQQRLAPRLQ